MPRLFKMDEFLEKLRTALDPSPLPSFQKPPLQIFLKIAILQKFHEQYLLFQTPKSEMAPPPLVCFRKFIQFGESGHP